MSHEQVLKTGYKQSKKKYCDSTPQEIYRIYVKETVYIHDTNKRGSEN